MSFTDTLLDFLTGRIPDADPEDHDLARRAYADFIDVQLAGFQTENARFGESEAGFRVDHAGLRPEKVAALRARLYVADDNNPGSKVPAELPVIMGIETRLAAALPDGLASRTYWIVRDRFNRIASSQAATEYARWAPPELHEARVVAVDDPLAVARQAETAALAAVGRASLDLDQAKSIPPDKHSADSDVALATATKVYEAAIAAAAKASQRVAMLEAAAAEPAHPETTDGN
ncbi:hypothetical protein QH494_26320 [Sphingomonas sp. AR_OL41]|uniref:hypothetical protein n=1 Tax=Sphingomonas sp. AR_OL41 TaxID=3042729 RepID=UPI00248095B3|nr:hypothetical protein [Sphingomonas sp. AR_OL41]MDH7975717.1 hypothetical protein [Sphingomonas sp. AR_OL41]